MGAPKLATVSWEFVLGADFLSRGIALFSAGGFSHVDAVTSNGFLLGSRADKVGGQPAGVHVRPPGYENVARRVRFDLVVTELQARRFYRFLDLQIGKPYDKPAILGFVSGRNWREDDSWFCSELQAAALEAARICPKLYQPSNKITPVALSTVLSALGAKHADMPLETAIAA